MLDTARLLNGIQKTQFVPAIFAFEEIDSTNEEAKRMAQNGFEGTALIVADRQSAGRGRMGRSFYSPAQTGAYFSILYTPASPGDGIVSITSAAAVAVMRAIRSLTGLQTEIKWVNDLYLDGKKVCGILAESMICGGRVQVVLGVGINLSTESFPQELANIAGALGVSAPTREDMIARVYNEIEKYLNAPDNRDWLTEYRAHSCVLGRQITWAQNGEVHEGRAVEIDGDGALIAERGDGQRCRLSTGEISVRVQNN